MQTSRNALRGFAVAALMCASVLSGGPLLADPGLGVNNAIAKGEVEPDSEYVHPMVVTNEGTEPVEVVLEARGFGQTLDGTYVALDEADDESPLSAREFVTGFDEPSFVLPPGSSKEVTASVSVPADVGEGTRYAIILVHVPAREGLGLATWPAVNVPVVLTASGPDTLAMTGSINEVEVVEAYESRPFKVSTFFTNSGNHHYKAFNEVEVRTTDGVLLESMTGSLTRVSLVPTFAHRFDTWVGSNAGLRAGSYSIESRVFLEDGTLLDTKTLTFEVVPYAPQRELPAIPWFIAGGLVLLILLLSLLLLAMKRRRKRRPVAPVA